MKFYDINSVIQWYDDLALMSKKQELADLYSLYSNTRDWLKSLSLAAHKIKVAEELLSEENLLAEYNARINGTRFDGTPYGESNENIN